MARRLVERLPSRNAARFSSDLSQRFSQCRGGTLKLAFRLFPWRGGSLSAYRADNNAATPRKFARKLAARPTGSAQHRREIERFRPYCFPDSGGLGLRQTLLGIFPRLFRSVSLDRHIRTPHHRPSSQVTLGSAQTRQGTLGSLDSPSAAASSTERRSTLNRRRKPRPSQLPRLLRSVSSEQPIRTPTFDQRAKPRRALPAPAKEP